MERLKNMGLKKSFFVLSACCMSIALILLALVFFGCNRVHRLYPEGEVRIEPIGNGVMASSIVGEPTRAQKILLNTVDIIQLLACVLFPVGGLAISGILFYRVKLKKPIDVLRDGMERIGRQNLDFQITEVSEDELGKLCMAFETMRSELLKTNRMLWEQAEERKRLNAAFSHDLRNPVTILKGTVKMLRQGKQDEQAIDRLENYTLRIENYIEAMSSIQRLEQMPVRSGEYAYSLLQREIEDTVRALAPSLRYEIVIPEEGTICLDHGIFLNVLENLVNNAARFARENIEIELGGTSNTESSIAQDEERYVTLSVKDDGSGYPAELMQNGPKPFGKIKETPEHLGMGLYSCQVLCLKHGGKLELENRESGGAAAIAIFKNCRPLSTV